MKNKDCDICNLDLLEIDTWDTKHRYGRLEEYFDNKNLKELLDEYGWRKNPQQTGMCIST